MLKDVEISEEPELEDNLKVRVDQGNRGAKPNRHRRSSQETAGLRDDVEVGSERGSEQEISTN